MFHFSLYFCCLIICVIPILYKIKSQFLSAVQCVCQSVFRKIEPYVIISIILVPNINKISKTFQCTSQPLIQHFLQSRI